MSLACGEQRPSAPQNQVAHRGPGDSLAKLLRLTLTAEDPVKATQAWKCEYGLLIRQYGPIKAEEIAQEVRDTIYGWRDWPARRRVENALAYKIIRDNCERP